MKNLEALCGGCDLAPDGSVRDHVLADDPGAGAECHAAAGFPIAAPWCAWREKNRYGTKVL